METLNVPDDMPIQNKLISNTIEGAQKKVEGRNFDIRKHIVQYDDVMNKHREIMYKRRRKLLESESVKNEIILLIEKEVEAIVLNHAPDPSGEGTWDYEKILEEANAFHANDVNPLNLDDLFQQKNKEDLIDFIKDAFFAEYTRKEQVLTDEKIMRTIERNVYLNVIDTLWMEHIDNMQHLRESVALKGYGQRDPLIEYKEQAFIMFDRLLASIQHNTVTTLFKINLTQQLPEHLLRASQPQQMMTNDAQISSVTEGDNPIAAPRYTASPLIQGLPKSHPTGNQQSQGNPVIIKADAPKVQQATKINPVGRNEPCPCGSGKKYKKCHGENKRTE